MRHQGIAVTLTDRTITWSMSAGRAEVNEMHLEFSYRLSLADAYDVAIWVQPPA
jgi:hypothetical protein